MGFVVYKVALGQVFFSEYHGFPLSILFHRCAINMEKQKKLHYLHHRVAQYAFKAAVRP
jgi:hypothetical protein